MQLADAGDMVAALAQGVRPTPDAPIIGDGVVPSAVTVHREARRKAGTSRDADRRWRVGRSEAAAPCGKRVQRRCRDNRVPSMLGDLAVVLVRHDDEQVLRHDGHRRSSGPVAGRSYKALPHNWSELFLRSSGRVYDVLLKRHERRTTRSACADRTDKQYGAAPQPPRMWRKKWHRDCAWSPHFSASSP